MRLHVTSEIGKLRSVLVHLPGPEIDAMVPEMMEELLFDDILYGQLAREEHRRFQQIIRYIADDVFDIQDLLEEVLDDDDNRELILADFFKRNKLRRAIREQLSELSAADLAEALFTGVLVEDPKARGPIFELTPVPNAFFMRDPQIVLGSGVAISSMGTEARAREPLLSSYIFRYHSAFRDKARIWMDPTTETRSTTRRRATLEGGDVLVARDDLLLVGLSERTNRLGIERLAESLRAGKAGIRTILVVDLPKQRSCMHLDTVFTLLSQNECLYYPPIIARGGREEAEVYRVDLDRREMTFTVQKALVPALAKCGMDLEAIPCGGRRIIDQEREQWTDGANAFTLAPGIVLLYDRNTETAAELERHGYEIVRDDDLLLGRTELETWTDQKYAIMIQGHELSRARGGPRCMTMPLEREDV